MDPSSAAAAIALVGGTAMQMSAQREERKDRRNVLNRQLERDDSASKKSNELVLNEGELFAPGARREAMEQTETKAYDRSLEDLKAGAGGGELGTVHTSSDAGNVSEDFVKGRAARAATEGTRLMAVAREAAKTRAPSLQLVQEGQRRGNLASALQNLYGTNRNMANATQNDAASVQQPEYGQWGAIASTLGSAYLGGRGARSGAQTRPSGGISFGSGTAGMGD